MLRLIWNLSLDKFRQQDKRFLPAEIARLSGNDSGYAFLHDVQFRATRNFFERDRRLHFASQIWIVKFVRVANAFVRRQFDIRSAEGMALARREVRKRHFISAANFGVHLMNPAGESVWRKPFGHRVWIKKGAINFLRRCPEHSVEMDRVCGHDFFRFCVVVYYRSDRLAYLAFVSGSIIPKTLPAGSAA